MGAKAAEFNIDPDRMGLMGDSAGGYLAAMVALAGDWFTVADRDGVNAAAPATVKAVVGFYGIYDMLAQWQQDMKVSPGDSITEDFLGVSPSRNRQLYLESSPIAYAASATRFGFSLSTATATIWLIPGASQAPSLRRSQNRDLSRV